MGLAKPELLHTYSNERNKVAHDLIEFDQKVTICDVFFLGGFL